jgi:bifunctional UDP-N-acetylglucosamine pyrophosphorylase/glucosamine-1-phosphate N-acetyltransferase
MENVQVLILAAGKGTRMKSRQAKVLHKVGGASLLEHVLRAAQPVASKVLVVVGHQADKVKAVVPTVTAVEQKEQLGTGHAVLCAREALSGFTGDLLVLPGDVPLISRHTLEDFLRFHREGGFVASVLTAEIAEPFGYGRIVRSQSNDAEIEAIVEHRDASPEVLRINEINSSIYVFNTAALFESLTGVGNKNSQAEYYLTDVIGILAGRKQKVGAYKARKPVEVLGINTRQELAAMDHFLRQQKCESLMAEGVTIVDPESTFIDVDVQIGPDTVIYPSVQLEGRTVIGEDVTIRSFSRITNCKIASRVQVLESCVLADSEFGEDVSVGPFAHVRMHAVLEDTVKVGNFVEIKKSRLGRGTKSGHLAYIGDATIGKKVNISAGVITANYDGTNKHETHIGDDAFIGTNSTLIAPVRVETGAFVAAGSTITHDIPAEALAIARERQVIKENRAPHRKKKAQT